MSISGSFVLINVLCSYSERTEFLQEKSYIAPDFSQVGYSPDFHMLSSSVACAE